MKKKISISQISNIRKQERAEPNVSIQEPKKVPQKKRVGRPSERTAYVQLNTRIKQSTSLKIDEIIDRSGGTVRETIERAIEELHKKK